MKVSLQRLKPNDIFKLRSIIDEDTVKCYFIGPFTKEVATIDYNTYGIWSNSGVLVEPRL